MLLKKNGKVLLFGRSDYRQMSLGQTSIERYPFYLTSQNDNIIQVCGGSGHMLLLKGLIYLMTKLTFNLDDGKVYSFGRNDNGQLGQGNSNNPINYPAPLASENYGIFQIACGREHSLILKYTNQCFGKSDATMCSGRGLCIEENKCSCSKGYYGNECQNYDCFGKNSTDSNVCSGHGTCTNPNVCACNDGYIGSQCEIYSGNSSTSNTLVYAFGKNNQGQLGVGGGGEQLSPKLVSAFNFGIEDIFGGYETFFMKNNASIFFSAGSNNVNIIDF